MSRVGLSRARGRARDKLRIRCPSWVNCLQARSKKMSRHLLSRYLRRYVVVATVPSTPTHDVYDMAVGLMTADFFARMWFKAKDKWAIYKAKDASVHAVGRT